MQGQSNQPTPECAVNGIEGYGSLELFIYWNNM